MLSEMRKDEAVAAQQKAEQKAAQQKASTAA